MIVLTGLAALCATGCSTTRSVSAVKSEELRVKSETVSTTDCTNFTDTSDSVTITKTVTVILREPQDRQSPPDTVKVSTVTDRTRTSVRDRVKEVEVRSEIRVDTVYVERRDSVFVQNTNLTNPPNKASPFTKTVKWLAILVIAIAVLVGLIKIKF